MRAARLITMMGLLQERGRMSASQLAETLEVSVRTVLRDVEALNSAGIHVHAHRGASGGFELDESATLVRTPTSVAHGRPTRTAEVLVSPHGRQVASLVGRPAGLRYRRRLDRRGWTAATMRFSSVDSAATELLSLGANVEVVSPNDLRLQMHDVAAQVARLHR